MRFHSRWGAPLALLNRLLSRVGLVWVSREWALDRVREWHPNGLPFRSTTLFALRCIQCLRPTTGCGKHWFCGICPACAAALDEFDDDDEVA